MKKEHIIPSIEKTIALLEYLGKLQGGASQGELVAELDITASTCYRILQTLQKHDWVRQQPGNKYDLANGMMPMLMKLSDFSARFALAQPALERLANRAGLSCKLSIRQGHEQVTILRAESPQPMTVSGKIGSRFPLIEGSVGAALLYAETPDMIADQIAVCTESIAEITDPQIVLSRIRDIHQQGYCLNIKYNRWKVEAMSSPVIDDDGRVIAAITLLGFQDDFRSDKLDGLSAALHDAVTECARLIS
ncbi:MAG TPA: IclR family transcriptional regulator [Armatimonadota bacterium]|nr:IclR family transcriptional regulator [Armatimonadota bacterium]